MWFRMVRTKGGGAFSATVTGTMGGSDSGAAGPSSDLFGSAGTGGGVDAVQPMPQSQNAKPPVLGRVISTRE